MTKTKHVTPAGDLIEHELTEDCVCGPDVLVLDEVEQGARLVVHHSLDGREDDE